MMNQLLALNEASSVQALTCTIWSKLSGEYGPTGFGCQSRTPCFFPCHRLRLIIWSPRQVRLSRPASAGCLFSTLRPNLAPTHGIISAFLYSVHITANHHRDGVHSNPFLSRLCQQRDKLRTFPLDAFSQFLPFIYKIEDIYFAG